MTFNIRNLTRVLMIAGVTMSIAACATHAPPPPPPPPAPPGPPPEPPPPPPPPPAPMGPVPGSTQDFVVNAGDRIYFDYDKSDIRADASPILDAQAAWLSRYPAVHVRIEGNCDERGTREYNFALGGRRANAVKEYLTAHGVDASRIDTVSYGKERPIDTGDDDAAYAKNRNGHTTLTAGEVQ